MTCHLRSVAVSTLLMGLLWCAPVQAQPPENDALRVRAEAGDAQAQYDLGIRYFNDADAAEAVRWLRLAAEKGDARAQFTLGRKYANGDDVPQDYAEALRWHRLAAEQAYDEALFALGDMYAFRRGVALDDVQAHLWYDLSASRGHILADRNRDRAAARMTPEQIAEAQRLAREWDAAHPRD